MSLKTHFVHCFELSASSLFTSVLERSDIDDISIGILIWDMGYRYGIWYVDMVIYHIDMVIMDIDMDMG